MNLDNSVTFCCFLMNFIDESVCWFVLFMSRLLSKEELSRYSDCKESNDKVGNIINPNSKIKVPIST